MTTGEPVCGQLPAPWRCSRGPKHEGPCEATRDPKVSERATHVVIKEHTDVKPAYYLSKEQREVAWDWTRKHDTERHMSADKKHRFTGAIGGAYTWSFTPTSLGVVSTLKCACGEKLDVSDYDSW